MHLKSRLAVGASVLVASVKVLQQPWSQVFNGSFHFSGVLIGICCSSLGFGQEYDGWVGDTLDTAGDAGSSKGPVNGKPHALQCLGLDKLGYECRQVW